MTPLRSSRRSSFITYAVSSSPPRPIGQIDSTKSIFPRDLVHLCIDLALCLPSMIGWIRWTVTAPSREPRAICLDAVLASRLRKLYLLLITFNRRASDEPTPLSRYTRITTASAISNPFAGSPRRRFPCPREECLERYLESKAHEEPSYKCKRCSHPFTRIDSFRRHSEQAKATVKGTQNRAFELSRPPRQGRCSAIVGVVPAS